MGRRSSVEVSAVNVVTHPHSASLYLRLFKAAFAQRQPVKLRGDQYAHVQSCFDIDQANPEQGVEGEVFRYTHIAADDPWFNIQTARVATDAERAVINIPDHLKPHLRRIRYVFVPTKHRIVWIARKERDTLSAHSAQLLFVSFLNHPDLGNAFPRAEVTVEQSHEALKQVLGMHLLKHLVIYLKKPNADEGDLNEAAILRELGEQNVETVQNELKAEEGKGIIPNKRSKLLARLAASNGFVFGVGKDLDNKRQAVNTKDHPLVQVFKADLKKIKIVEWFRNAANQVIQQITHPDEPDKE